MTLDRDQLLAVAYDKNLAWQFDYRYGYSDGLPDDDIYARAHRAADRWLEWYGPPDSELAVRAYGMVYFGGWKAGAGAVVRGWRDRLAQPHGRTTLDWVPDQDRGSVLMCPYRYSQHGGASPGGGTFASQYRKAWKKGVHFAEQHLRRLHTQLQADVDIYGNAYLVEGERVDPWGVKILGGPDAHGRLQAEIKLLRQDGTHEVRRVRLVQWKGGGDAVAPAVAAAP